MKKIRDYNNTMEVDYYYFSSAAATPEKAIDSLTQETSGDCLGPNDFANDIAEDAIAYLSAHWEEAEEMSAEEAEERISHLADEWNLSPDELAYLK